MSENQPAPEDAVHDAPEQDRKNRRRLWLCGAVHSVSDVIHRRLLMKLLCGTNADKTVEY
jgi:hypothetical protein